MILLAILVLNWVLVEGSMLRSEKYVIGTTLGFCQVFAQGKGIEFQYQVEGRVYKNCIAPHPIPIDQIEVPDGRYQVRYAPRFPDKGRMDFSKLLNK